MACLPTISLRLSVSALAAMLFVITSSEVLAQSKYALTWVSTGGAIGTTTGAKYSLSRTTGSADADLMHGSVHTLAGSFWSGTVLASQSGPPLMSIALTPTAAITISWPSASTGWALQQTSSLSTTNWTDVPTPPTDDGTNKSVTMPRPAVDKFYRLHRP
jgi:hypothetical protein